MRNRIIIVVIIIILNIIICFYRDVRYVLKDCDQVVITQFGEVVGTAKVVPGMYFKLPFLQKAHYYQKDLYSFEMSEEMETKDQKYVQLKFRVFWQISDPVQYYKAINSDYHAKNFILQHVGAAVQDFMKTHTISEIVDKNNDQSEFQEIKYSQLVEPEIAEARKETIETVSIHLKRIELKVISLTNKKQP